MLTPTHIWRNQHVKKIKGTGVETAPISIRYVGYVCRLYTACGSEVNLTGSTRTLTPMWQIVSHLNYRLDYLQLDLLVPH